VVNGLTNGTTYSCTVAAATVQEYVVPLVSPFTTIGLDVAVPVMATPPVGVHTYV